MPSANALMEAGFQIGGGKQNPEVQSYFEQGEKQGSARSAGSYSTPGVEYVDTSGKTVEASQTITETPVFQIF